MDGLCGIYAIINAVTHLMQPNESAEEAEALFAKLINALAEQYDFSETFFDGITDRDMCRLLRSIVASQYNITVKRPFYWRRAVFKDMWRALTVFTANGGVAICGDENHWWVVTHASNTRLDLLDSDLLFGGRDYVTRKNLEREGLDGRYLYFMSKSEEVTHG